MLVTPTLVLVPGFTGVGTTASLPISLALTPPGTILYNQTVGFCPTDPTGFVFWPFQVLTVGGL